MKKLILSLVVFFSISAIAETECLWINYRDNVTFETISDLKNADSIDHCFHILRKPVVLTEPMRNGNEFEGIAVIREIHSDKIIASCPTRTVNGLDANDPTDRGRMLLFFQDVEESGDMSGATTTNSEKWQNYFNSKIRMGCQ